MTHQEAYGDGDDPANPEHAHFRPFERMHETIPCNRREESTHTTSKEATRSSGSFGHTTSTRRSHSTAHGLYCATRVHSPRRTRWSTTSVDCPQSSTTLSWRLRRAEGRVGCDTPPQPIADDGPRSPRPPGRSRCRRSHVRRTSQLVATDTNQATGPCPVVPSLSTDSKHLSGILRSSHP